MPDGRKDKRINAMTTIQGVMAELRRVYRSTRRGELSPSDALKQANILRILGDLLTAEDLANRLKALEQGDGPQPAAPGIKNYGELTQLDARRAQRFS